MSSHCFGFLFLHGPEYRGRIEFFSAHFDYAAGEEKKTSATCEYIGSLSDYDFWRIYRAGLPAIYCRELKGVALSGYHLCVIHGS